MVADAKATSVQDFQRQTQILPLLLRTAQGQRQDDSASEERNESWTAVRSYLAVTRMANQVLSDDGSSIDRTCSCRECRPARHG